MKNTALLLAFLSVCHAAPAAEPDWYGEANCRIAPLEPHPRGDFVKWSGACKDGYADGKGTLAWHEFGHAGRTLEATLVRGAVSGEGTLIDERGTYIGTLRSGVPHGEGYFKYADGKALYEGGIANGQRDGTGINIDRDRSRYEGQWKNDRRDGYGKEVFALGGSYEGQWKDDKFEGQGAIVYAGSGRRYEGQFRDGHVADSAATEKAERGEYTLHADYHMRGSALKATAAVGYGPLNATWPELTPGQQALVKSFYKALEDGDEPPYPLHGTGKLYKDIVQIRNAKFLGVTGELLLHVLVGRDGKPKSVAAIGSPDPELARFASMVMMTQAFKPAVCHGEPCEMIYPVEFSFTMEN
jgi:hypothetical protein